MEYLISLFINMQKNAEMLFSFKDRVLFMFHIFWWDASCYQIWSVMSYHYLVAQHDHSFHCLQFWNQFAPNHCGWPMDLWLYLPMCISYSDPFKAYFSKDFSALILLPSWSLYLDLKWNRVIIMGCVHLHMDTNQSVKRISWFLMPKCLFCHHVCCRIAQGQRTCKNPFYYWSSLNQFPP